MIKFKQITKKNFGECIKIETGIDEKYLPPIVYQIALSYIFPSKIPLAIYEEDELIGFVSYEIDVSPDIAYDILVFVIDKNKQGKGKGTLAFNAFIDYLAEFDDCNLITLNYNKENKAAEKLYKGSGFKRTGMINKDNNEIIMRLDVNKR
ncbi:GNAT family N-acetyltransferase [Mycoplasmatota bacterium]|nr:GNAT family N-acetyltransferase [Mycoplasmatota bacterium]